jgi:sugar lactone lactonase YvrE
MKHLLQGIIFMLMCSSMNAQTPRITIKIPQLYPEGIVFDTKKNVFYISSVRTGTIGTVDKNGNYKVFYEDSTMKSSFGMKIDAAHNKLWVCTGDPNYSKYSDSSTFKKIARLQSFDLSSGKKVNDVDLAKMYNGKHFANDVTIDDKGNLYITDSYSPVIYKVDPQGNATLFTENEFFKAPEIGLNGIAFHPDGFLLVVNNNKGAIYKIDINDPKKVTKVKTPSFYPGADGLLIDQHKNLVLVQNKGIDKVSLLTSNDNWQSAELKAATTMEDRFANPSTATFDNEKIYVLNSKLNELSDPNKKPSKEFSIQIAELKALK